MNPRAALHGIRDAAVRLAAERPFRPIEHPRRRVVLVRPDHFGDMLMLAPTLNAFRNLVDRHEIILMTGPWNHEVATHIVSVDAITTYPFPGFAREVARPGILDPYRQLSEAAATVRDLQPQAIVLLRDDHWWGAWMAREAGVPLRFGYAGTNVEPFLSHPINVGHSHYVQQNAHLLSTAFRILGYTDTPGGELTFRMTWPVLPDAAERARSLLVHYGIRGNYLVVHPGTGAPVKNWPARRWASVIDTLSERTGMPVLLTGAPNEEAICNLIDAHARNQTVNLAGQTTLYSLGELLRGASLVLGVDSGPLHLATAVGTPSIHLYGPSDPIRYGPWGDRRWHRVVSAGMHCPACGDLSPSRPEGCGCMMAIAPSSVVENALEMLGNA